MKNCKACAYSELQGSGHLQCRRNPPIAAMQSAGAYVSYETTLWPNVAERDWCGEFKEKPDVAE